MSKKKRRNAAEVIAAVAEVRKLVAGGMLMMHACTKVGLSRTQWDRHRDELPPIPPASNPGATGWPAKKRVNDELLPKALQMAREHPELSWAQIAAAVGMTSSSLYNRLARMPPEPRPALALPALVAPAHPNGNGNGEHAKPAKPQPETVFRVTADVPIELVGYVLADLAAREIENVSYGVVTMLPRYAKNRKKDAD